MNSLDWIAKWAEQNPAKTALKDLETGEKFTYRQLDLYANCMVEYLKQQIKEGDRIAVLLEQSPHLIALFSACQRLGAILVPLNYKLSSPEIIKQIKDCRPTVIVSSELFEDKISLLKDTVQILRLIDFVDCCKKLEKNLKTLKKFSVKEDLPVFLFYTTGTTAQPKGVLYTNKMLFWNSLNTSMQLGISAEDHTLNILPPYHTSGWNIFLTPLLHHGGSVSIMKKIEADKVLFYLAEEKVTLFLALPTILQMISKSENFAHVNLPFLRYVVCGGEKISEDQINLWRSTKNVNIRPGYGLTEAGPSITTLHQDFVLEKPDSIGKANFYVDLKIVDEKGDEAKTNEVGELCIKGNIVTPGYWNNSVATKDKIKEDWFHTGDLALKDSEGFYFLKGRKDDMYISGGENIFPLEIENILLKHPEIEKAQIIPFDDHTWGKKGVVFIMSDNENLRKEDIQEFLKDKLAKFKHPKEFIFLKQFPITGFGKISRIELIRLYLNQQEKTQLNS